MQRALGVDNRQLGNEGGWKLRNDAPIGQHEMEEDTRAFRMLAEAIETAVRGGKEDMLGLDWDDQ